MLIVFATISPDTAARLQNRYYLRGIGLSAAANIAAAAQPEHMHWFLALPQVTAQSRVFLHEAVTRAANNLRSSIIDNPRANPQAPASHLPVSAAFPHQINYQTHLVPVPLG
jgi:hypothetical protein